MGFSVLLDVINFYLLSHASITARLFTFPRTTSRDLLHHHMKSYTELHYKADARRPTVLLSRGRKSFVAFRRVIVHYVRRSTLLIRKSTLIAEKCSELRRSLWIRVFSCRRRTFNVRRRSEVNCGVESSSIRSRARLLPLLVYCMFWCQTSVTSLVSSSVDSLFLGKPFVATKLVTSNTAVR